MGTYGEFDKDKVDLFANCELMAGTADPKFEFAVLFEGLLYTHDPKTKQMTLRSSEIDFIPTGEQVVGKFDYKQMKIKWDKDAIRYHRQTLFGLVDSDEVIKIIV
eukprot:SAG22_NODE_231_length_14551_cov_22.298090_17_plen_105_part_00